jgi:hypothetical protein
MITSQYIPVIQDKQFVEEGDKNDFWKSGSIQVGFSNAAMEMSKCPPLFITTPTWALTLPMTKPIQTNVMYNI